MSEILGTLFKGLLSLLGVVVVVGAVYAAFGTSKTQSAISGMSQLQTNTQVLYYSQSAFTSVNNAVAITGKLATPDMISGTNLINPWGGTVTISVNATNPSQFDIAHSASIPADSCAKMVGGLGTAVGIKINGTAQTLPLDSGAAVIACNATANAMTFTFGH